MWCERGSIAAATAERLEREISLELRDRPREAQVVLLQELQRSIQARLAALYADGGPGIAGHSPWQENEHETLEMS